ncbi:MAG: phospholipase D-like domain-containing protein, partial [Candidatus Sericytochromatia bacterium]
YKGLYEENEKIARKDPNNPDKIFIKIVKNAKKTIDLAIFDIEEPNSVKAIIDAKNRGLQVRIVTDSDNLNDKVNYSQPRPAIEALKQAGIPIVDDKRTAFMHNKFAIIDSETVITGSMNLSVNSMFRDNNNAIKIVSKEIAQNYQEEFNRMFEQKIFGPPGPRNIPFPEVKVGSAVVKTFFSPKGGTREAVLEELRKAKNSIRFTTFSLTDKDTQALLLEKDAAGVLVEGVFDGCMLSKYSSYYEFLKSKMPVYIDGNQALLHNKIFIVDNRTVITGSYNFSNNAENNNNENVIIIKSDKMAKYYRDEFFRLKKASQTNTNLPPYDNRTCGATDNGNDDTHVLSMK